MQVISAWEIYAVMQLDSFKIVLLIAVMTSLIVALFASLNNERLAKTPLVVAGILALGIALTPDSKTAAAMIVIPAIANNETVHKEAGELYKLAKEGFADLVKSEENDGE